MISVVIPFTLRCPISTFGVVPNEMAQADIAHPPRKVTNHGLAPTWTQVVSIVHYQAANSRGRQHFFKNISGNCPEPEEMTNDQIPMTNGECLPAFIGHWCLVIGHLPSSAAA